MIIYDSNANWFKDIIKSYKSDTLLLLFKRVIAIGLFSTLNIYLYQVYWGFGNEDSFVSKMFTYIGIALSILLVFRTNTAYDRWWEGRKQWGNLVNNSRSVALLVDAKLAKHDEENRRYFAKNISNYAFALSAHLRGVFRKDLLYDVKNKDEKSLEIHYHAPNYIAKKLYGRTVRLLEQGHLSEFVELKILDHLAQFNEITGACERIKTTPIPFSYRTFLKIFILVYTILLPFAFANSLQYYAVPLTMFQFFVLVGLESLAEEIEDPFENNSNDLPTYTISTTIKNNVYEILGFYEEVSPPAPREIYKVID